MGNSSDPSKFAAQCADGEWVDVTLTIEGIHRDESPVAYYARGKTTWGERVRVTVFENNRPEVNIQEGQQYFFQNAMGEVWDGDGTLGIKFTSQSSVTPVETSESADHDRSGTSTNGKPTATPKHIEAGHEITEDHWVSLTLTVNSVYEKTDSDVAYFAWCTDEVGETVAVTVFKDNLPETDIRSDNRYRFENVRGERWPDGTPGIVFRPQSTVRQLEANTESPTTDRPTDLVIDAVSPEEYDTEQLISGVNMYSVVPPAFSGGAVALGTYASVFASGLGAIQGGVIIIFAGALSALTTYVSQNTSLKSLRRRQNKPHVRALLEMLKQDYFELVETDASVRANVLLTDDGLLRRGSELSVFASSGGYKSSETELRFDVGKREGPWARCCSDGEIKVFDWDSAPEPLADLMSKQAEVLRLQSGVAVPLTIRNGHTRRTVGVLSLDSEAPLEETNFDDGDVESLLVRYTDLIEEVLD